MTRTLTLRTTTRRDLAAIDALLSVSYPALLRADYPPSVMVTAVPVISRAQPALLTCGTYYLIEDEGGTALAAGGWTPRSPGVGRIRHVATHPDALRRGLARTILSHALDTAREAGVTRMLCESTRTAVPFYAAMGFVETGPVTIPLRAGIDFPAIAMERAV